MHTRMTCFLLLQLLAEGEVWPGVSGAEFAARRQRLADLLPIGGVALLPAAQKVCMTGAIPYPYRQARTHARSLGMCMHMPCITRQHSISVHLLEQT